MPTLGNFMKWRLTFMRYSGYMNAFVNATPCNAQDPVTCGPSQAKPLIPLHVAPHKLNAHCSHSAQDPATSGPTQAKTHAPQNQHGISMSILVEKMFSVRSLKSSERCFGASLGNLGGYFWKPGRGPLVPPEPPKSTWNFHVDFH